MLYMLYIDNVHKNLHHINGVVLPSITTLWTILTAAGGIYNKKKILHTQQIHFYTLKTENKLSLYFCDCVFLLFCFTFVLLCSA